MKAPKQITLRNVSPALAHKLETLSRDTGESVNSTVLHLLERALGVNPRRAQLERYMTWTDSDFRDFQESLRGQRVVDSKLWR